MNKVYLLLLLIVMSLSARAQYDDYDQIIERDILGADAIDSSKAEKKQLIGAARSSKSMEDLPVTVFTISHDDIVNYGYATLCDVLKTVPGIRVSQPYSYDCGEGFMQRGMNGNIYSKILINGVDVKPSGTTGMPLSAAFPVRQAEKIEIIYGPASASYGNDACGGVINIITRKPTVKDFTSADIMVGSGGKAYLNFHTGTKLGHGKHVAELSFYGTKLSVVDMQLPDEEYSIYNRWNYLAQDSVKFKITTTSDGDVYYVSADAVQKEIFEKYENTAFSDLKYYTLNYDGNDDESGGKNDGFYKPSICKRPQKASQIGLELKYRWFNFAYNLMHRTDYTNLGVTGFTYNLSDPHAISGEYIHRFVLSGDISVGNLSNNVTAHFIHYRVDENSCRSVNWDERLLYYYGASDDIGIEDNLTWKPIENLEINAGASFTYSGVLPKTMDNATKFDYTSYKMFAKSVDFTYPDVGSFGIYPYTYNNSAVYAQADYGLGPVSLVAGVRYDYSSMWYSSTNPRLAAIWKVNDKFSVRASQGFAYKAPSGNQMYYTVAITDLDFGYGFKINAYQHIPAITELEPEKISSTEVGARYFFNKSNYLELVAYTNRIKNPLVRKWVSVEQAKQDSIIPNIGYVVGVSNFNDATLTRQWTRSYANEDSSMTKLYSLQLIGVFKDIWQPIHLGISGALTLSMGSEKISTGYSTTSVIDIDYVRGVPKAMFQLSVDFSFKRILYFRFDNVICSKTPRIYFTDMANLEDNAYYYGPSYYDLDFTFNIKMNKNLSGLFKIGNVTNTQYGGMDVFDMDVDLPYNPQYLRTFTFGISYNF